MSEYHLSSPVSKEDVRRLRVGDTVYYDGLIATGRDAVHERVTDGGLDLPCDISGCALYHAGPIVRKTGDGYEIVSAGPTTSMRMESREYGFIKKTGARLIIGKGGMGEKTAAACRDFGAVHTVFPGGCAVLAAECVESVSGVGWPELGMPEAVWILKVKNFGPLVVSIDTHGGNMFAHNKALVGEKRDEAIEKILCKI